MNDYTNTEELTSATSTYAPPTKEEDEKTIINLAKELLELKWWQSDVDIIKSIKRCAYRLSK